MEESSSSTDSNFNDRSPSTLKGRTHKNKSALATTGINGTRNLIKSLIDKKTEELRELEEMQGNANSSSQVGVESLGVDLERFRERISFIQAKNK